eukprot:TRINITY_DN30400_c0_g2_i1.p1 TRINITY_DN30400_c0_g2~~TRINITY_DN30400_c0_g2_i1.p1  ORF type:complete len:1175 (-),score=174.41 TRINITY_DN30400_c0_g2_i1:69-3443(-)
MEEGKREHHMLQSPSLTIPSPGATRRPSNAGLQSPAAARSPGSARSPSSLTGRPNPLLAGSPKRDRFSSPSTSYQHQFGGTTPSQESEDHGDDISTDFGAVETSDATSLITDHRRMPPPAPATQEFAPAVFLESLLDENQTSPAKQATRKIPKVSSKKSSKLKLPSPKSSEGVARAPSGEPLLNSSSDDIDTSAGSKPTPPPPSSAPPSRLRTAGRPTTRSPAAVAGVGAGSGVHGRHRSRTAAAVQQMPLAQPAPPEQQRMQTQDQEACNESAVVDRSDNEVDGDIGSGRDRDGTEERPPPLMAAKSRGSALTSEAVPPPPPRRPAEGYTIADPVRPLSRGKSTRVPRPEKEPMPTFGTVEARPSTDSVGSSVVSLNSGSATPTAANRSDRSPSLIKDGADFDVKTNAPQLPMGPTLQTEPPTVKVIYEPAPHKEEVDFRDPVKKPMFNSPSMLGDGGVCKNMSLSALAGAPRPPLIIRLARVQDIGDARYMAPSPCPALLALTGLQAPPGPNMAEYKELQRQLHQQRALRASSTDARADLKALVRWYFPYLCVIAVYITVAALAGAFQESAVATLPLVVLITILHIFRVTWCDRMLIASVDNSAASDARAQLRPPPMGWGGGDGMFSAMLLAALREVSASQELLMARPKRSLLRRAPACAVGIFTVLGIARLIRACVADHESLILWLFAEAAVSIFAAFVMLFVGCAPWCNRSRVAEADMRLAALEAAFNALLDSLKPLLTDPPRDLPPSPGDMQSRNAPGQDRKSFSIRLITASRLTLRATLELRQSPQVGVSEDATAELCVSCALGEFCVIAPRLERAVSTDLGRSAAGNAELPASPSVVPGGGPSTFGLPGLSLTAWANAMVAARQSPQRRQDDEMSISMASASTASTLQSRGEKGVRDEAVLHLAMGTVQALGRFRGEPLEAFRADVPGSVVPPKTHVDEPALLLSFQAGCVRVVGSAEPPPPQLPTKGDRGPLSVPVLCCSNSVDLESGQSKDAGVRDRFGVLRNSAELRRLCSSSSSHKSRLGTPETPSTPPRTRNMNVGSVAESLPETDDEELNDCSSRSLSPVKSGRFSPVNIGVQGEQLQLTHLAIIFDTYRERNQCRKMLQDCRLVPPDFFD